MSFKTFLTFLFTCFLFAVYSQAITFKNPSFEGIPKHSTLPRYWSDCGFPKESPPDILPNKTFQAVQAPHEGDSYLGMVARDNSTWESVMTTLSDTLMVDSCYQFQIALAQSERYISASRTTNMIINYNSPTKLRIWGGTSNCHKEELLAESPVINHSEWRIYDFIISTSQHSIAVITLEVISEDHVERKKKKGGKSNGNILLDAASGFHLLSDCIIPDSATQVALIEIEGINRQSFVIEDEEPEQNTYQVLQLPDLSQLSANEGKDFMNEALDSMIFGADQQFMIKGFSIAPDATIYLGQPHLHSLLQMLQHFPEDAWSLVIYHDAPSVLEQRFLEISNQIPADILVPLMVSRYNAELYADTKWFSKSVKNGLYLLRKQ